MSAMAREGKVGEARWAPSIGKFSLAVLLFFGFCYPAPAAQLPPGFGHQSLD